MNTIDFNKNDFPLTTTVLGFMQASYKMLELLTNIAGPNFVLSGCDGYNPVTAGIVVVNGEIMPFEGGARQDYVKVVTDYPLVELQGGSYTKTEKRLVFGTGTGQIAWSGFPRLTPTTQLARISSVVTLGGNQSIEGVKQFFDSPVVPTPLQNNEAANKGYVDGKGFVKTTTDESVDGVKTFAKIPLIPTTAPTSDAQVASKKYVDDVAVNLTTAQSISGVKTFNILPVIPETPGQNNHPASKKYVDNLVGDDTGWVACHNPGAVPQFDVWIRRRGNLVIIVGSNGNKGDGGIYFRIPPEFPAVPKDMGGCLWAQGADAQNNRALNVFCAEGNRDFIVFDEDGSGNVAGSIGVNFSFFVD